MLSTQQSRQRLMSLDRESLERFQLERLNRLLAAILPENRFYADKLGTQRLQLARLPDLQSLPLTTKSELTSREGYCWPVNLTYGDDRYLRYHQTSGTSGEPMVVLDTADDWLWWVDSWQYVLDAAQINEHDRAHLSFSFGPYIGFWSAHDALLARGTMVIPSGGMSSLMRLDLLARSRATVLLCTPSYALRLAEVAEMNGIRTQDLSIRKVIVAGEPGGSIPSTSARVAEAWNAQVYDHAGATEVGPWGFPDANRTGLYVLEAEFIAEFIQLDSDQPAEEGSEAELVLTTLGRDGCPVLRYRTGDVVRPSRAPDHNVCFTFLPGGVQGRVDDMWTIRGMNVFPSSIDAILREFEQVREYRVTARRHGALDELAIEVEDVAGDPDKIADTLHRRLGLAIRVDAVPLGSLPRFEGKARRVVDLRKE